MDGQPYLRVTGTFGVWFDSCAVLMLTLIVEQPSEATQLMRLRRRELKAAPWHFFREVMLFLRAIRRLIWAWIYFVIIFGVIFASWDRRESKILRAILLYIFDQDHTMRDIVGVSVGLGTSVYETLPDFESWEIAGAIGEVGGMLLVGQTSLAF